MACTVALAGAFLLGGCGLEDEAAKGVASGNAAEPAVDAADAAAEKAAAEKAAAEKADAEKADAARAALTAELQPKLEAELAPHRAKCVKAAEAAKAVLRKMRKAAETGELKALSRYNDQLGPLGMKAAVATDGGTKLIDSYEERGMDVQAVRDAYYAACSTELD